MDEKILSAITIIVIATIYVIEKVWSGRTIESLTEALSEAKNNSQLIEQGRMLAKEVVPVELAHRILDVTQTVTSLVKTFTPDNIDKAIDQGQQLAEEILNPDAIGAQKTTTVTTTTTAVENERDTPLLGTEIK